MAITDPTDIAGLQLWLNPGSLSGLSNGDTVTSVPDDSGNGYDATDASGGNPVYDDGATLPHGRPGVRFGQTTDQRLEVTSTTHGGALDLGVFTYVVVALTEVPNTNSFIFGKDASGSAMSPGLRHNINNLSDGQFNAVTTDSGGQNNAIQAGFRGHFTDIHVIRCDGATLDYRINGEQVASTSSGTTLTGTGDLAYGNHPSADNSSPGVLYDFVVYDSSLSLADVEDLEAWARDKFPFDWTLGAKLFADEAIGNTFIDGSTAYFFTVDISDAQTIYERTAPTSDPFNWSSRTSIYTASFFTRDICIKKYNGTWYMYVADRNNGGIYLNTSSDRSTWTQQNGGAAIITGSGTVGQDDGFLRYPFVLTPDETHDAGWHALIDGREGAPRRGRGAVYHYTGTDSETWVQESKVLDGTGVATDWNADDVGAPSAILLDGTYQIFFQSFNELDDNRGGGFPHYLGRATSTDLTAANTILQTQTPFIPYTYGGWANGNTGNPRPYDPGDGNLYVVYQGHEHLSDGGTRNDPVGYATSKTIAGTDNQPPSYTAGPTVTVTGSNSTDHTATTDEDCKRHLVILSDGAAAPSKQQIVDGTDGNDSAAEFAAEQVVTAGQSSTITSSGLAAGTAYDWYEVAEDQAANLGTIQSGGFTTDSAVTSITPDDATHSHTASEPAVTFNAPTFSVSPDSATHAHTASEPTLTPTAVVSPAGATHGHTATEPSLTFTAGTVTVTPDDATHAHTASRPTLTPTAVASPDSATHGHTASEPTLTGTGVGTQDLVIAVETALGTQPAPAARLGVQSAPAAREATAPDPGNRLITAPDPGSRFGTAKSPGSRTLIAKP